MTQFCAFLYSKYSKKSTVLAESLQFLPNLVPVCVDNAKIREQICKSTLVQISEVPCILIVHHDGVVEKYEGNMAFQWIKTQQPTQTIQHVQPTHVQPTHVVSQPPQREPQRRQSVQKVAQQFYPEEEIQEEFQEEEYQGEDQVEDQVEEDYQVYPTELIPDETPIELPSIKSSIKIEKKQKKKKTQAIKRPPVGIRNGSGGYDITEDFSNQEATKIATPSSSRHIKKSTAPGTGKGNDLMSSAMLMQKQREESIPTPQQKPYQ